MKTASRLTDEDIERLRRGVELKDGSTKPAVAERLRDAGSHTFFEITITEGRNRQVRRMVEALGSRVLKLVRIAIGPIRIGSLEIGKHRPLASGEVQTLRAAAKGAAPGKH